MPFPTDQIGLMARFDSPSLGRVSRLIAGKARTPLSLAQVACKLPLHRVSTRAEAIDFDPWPMSVASEIFHTNRDQRCTNLARGRRNDG
jgi:hypothetical protein